MQTAQRSRSLHRLHFMALLWAVLPALLVAQPATTYTVTFTSTWSSATHPLNFPSNPHFSGLIGATHNDTVSFWSEGSIASPGIEQMAETGGKTGLQSEIQEAQQAGTADFVLNGGGISVSPGSVELEFFIREDHPYVSLVSMIAPSPDWFVGVDKLLLYENGAWKDRVEVDLSAYDAGSDSGSNYTSANADTQPKQVIASITGGPFQVGGNIPSLGTFVFQCVMQCSGTNTSVDETIVGPFFHIEPPFPNPTSNSATIHLPPSGDWSVTINVFDALGRLRSMVYEGPATGQPVTASFENLSTGVYYIRATSSEATQTYKIVVVR